MKSSSRPADDELDRLVALGITRQQVEPGDDCLDPEVLAGYADGGLSAEEGAAVEAHLATCRDCRRALTLLVESEPVAASTTAPAVTSTGIEPARGTAGRPAIMKFATTWLPLAAALVVAAGLWAAFYRTRHEPQLSSAPAQFSARNEPLAAHQAQQAAGAQPEAARRPAPPTSVPGDRSSGEAPRESAPASGAAVPLGGTATATAPPSASASSSAATSSSRADAAVPAPAPMLGRARGTFREESAAAAAARPNAAEADRRIAPGPDAGRAPAPAVAPAPPPPSPPPAALADAAPARLGGAAGQEAQQAKAAGQLASQAPPPAAPAAAAPAPAPTQNAANQNAPQQVTLQQNAINQQTGPSANLNVAPPPAKTDERRQADASKREGTDSKSGANERGSGAAPGTKSVDGFAKATEEPKSMARAKAAPATPAASAPVDAASGRKTEAENAASGAAGAGAGARPAEVAPERAVAEAITVITASPTPRGVLQSVDGVRWWRIRAPSTIEGSSDRGASWTVEYSDPSTRLLRGTAGAKGGCWMIGANGLVLRTRPDGGWERVKQPTTRDLLTLTATSHLIATVTDDQGRAYRTTDGGATWR